MIFRQNIRYLRKSLESWGIFSNLLGWKRSFNEGRSLDAQGNPIPWYTYPAIEFLRTLDLKDCRVFEYGCGNSSIFLAKRVKELFAAENDAAWAAEVGKANIPNLTILTLTEKESYINAPHQVGGKFDLVIIDGRNRKDCANVAVDVVTNEGFIIFDNADWYPEACRTLRSKGWFQVDFSGLGPINSYAWTTALFIRTPLSVGRLEGVRPTGGNPAGESLG
jgi:hypothetical protein